MAVELQRIQAGETGCEPMRNRDEFAVSNEISWREKAE